MGRTTIRFIVDKVILGVLMLGFLGMSGLIAYNIGRANGIDEERHLMGPDAVSATCSWGIRSYTWTGHKKIGFKIHETTEVVCVLQ